MNDISQSENWSSQSVQKDQLLFNKKESSQQYISDIEKYLWEQRAERRIKKVKREARSELSVSQGDWKRRKYSLDENLVDTQDVVDTVPRIHVKNITRQDFYQKYEKPGIPVIIEGLMDDWPAMKEWTVENLVQKYGDHKFKVGSDDDGYAVRMKFKYYMHYITQPPHKYDDSPLYIFDSTFGDKETSKTLEYFYSVPSFFQEDLYHHVGENRRPPYKWFVMGPARSGSFLHQDPLATSAWNAVVRGTKRWALFPPGVPQHIVAPKEQDMARRPNQDEVDRDALKY